MPRITYAHPDGRRTTIQVEEGNSLMRAALENGIEGIAADCGGACSCGTCHVYVDGPAGAAPAPPGPMETEMLAFVAAERRPGSRLSCQLVADDALEGLVVRLPDRQHAG